MVKIPATFRFLGFGWVIVHAMAIPLVMYLGFLLAKHF
jgi:hypothetical protein